MTCFPVPDLHLLLAVSGKPQTLKLHLKRQAPGLLVFAEFTIRWFCFTGIESLPIPDAMGKLLSKIFGNKEMRILMLGLDAAGKTSILLALALNLLSPALITSPMCSLFDLKNFVDNYFLHWCVLTRYNFARGEFLRIMA